MPQRISTSENKPLREHIHKDLRHMIIERILPPNSRIIESQLSVKLGTSRTPLREALFKLEQEGFVKSDLAKGFTVNPLSSKEVKELYPIIWTLESLAINLASNRLSNCLEELIFINSEFTKAKGNPEKIIHLDISFHQTLTKECRNRHLLKQLSALKNLVHRYELSYMQDSSWVDDSINQHDQIIASILKKDFNLTIQIVEKNWRCGMDRISTWLDWLEDEDKSKNE